MRARVKIGGREYLVEITRVDGRTRRRVIARLDEPPRRAGQSAEDCDVPHVVDAGAERSSSTSTPPPGRDEP